MALTSKETIAQRIEAGTEGVMAKHIRTEKLACRRFLDPSLQNRDHITDIDEVEERIWDAGMGVIPHLATNIRIKVDSIAFTNPDFYVELQPEAQSDLTDIVRLYAKNLVTERNWMRPMKKAATKRHIAGHGVVCCYWDDAKGSCLEHVHFWDLSIDPHVTDFNDLRWGARKVKMPRDEAQTRWPEHKDVLGDDSADPGKDAPKGTGLDLWMYWDKTTEAVLYGKTLLQADDNLYGRVPLFFMDADVNPVSEFDTGDSQTCTGMAALRTVLDNAINNQGRHGGSITLYNPDAFDGASKNALETGQEQALYAVEGGDFDQAIKRIESEPMNPALLSADEKMQQSMDAAQGVNQYMRGVVSQPSKFATEVAATSQQSGVRGMVAQKEFERFWNMVIKFAMKITAQFAKPQQEQEFLFIEALSSISEICVIEESTAYKDPTFQQQQKRQLFLDALQAASVGLPIDVMAYWLDYNRACGIRDAATTHVQQQQPGQPNAEPGNPAPGQPAGAQPGQPPPGNAPPQLAGSGG